MKEIYTNIFFIILWIVKNIINKALLIFSVILIFISIFFTFLNIFDLNIFNLIIEYFNIEDIEKNYDENDIFYIFFTWIIILSFIQSLIKKIFKIKLSIFNIRKNLILHIISYILMLINIYLMEWKIEFMFIPILLIIYIIAFILSSIYIKIWEIKVI